MNKGKDERGTDVFLDQLPEERTNILAQSLGLQPLLCAVEYDALQPGRLLVHGILPDEQVGRVREGDAEIGVPLEAGAAEAVPAVVADAVVVQLVAEVRVLFITGCMKRF